MWTVSDFKYWAEKQGFRVVKYRGKYGAFMLWKVWPRLEQNKKTDDSVKSTQSMVFVVGKSGYSHIIS